MKQLLGGFVFIGICMADSVFATLPEIKLAVRKDLVLPVQMRIVVLETANTYLNKVDDGFMASVKGIPSPYAPKQPASVAAEAVDQESVKLVYDDTSILQVIGANFAKQVRGTLVKGTQHYLQLPGGGLLKSGTSFPAKIPQLEGQTFTVTISDIDSRAYTLKMATATLVIPLSPTSSGATLDNPE